jgi:hypothetical protein
LELGRNRYRYRFWVDGRGQPKPAVTHAVFMVIDRFYIIGLGGAHTYPVGDINLLP